jgi:hypothetical protein
MMLEHIAEKPRTVTKEDTISNFADSLQGRLAVSLRRPNPIISLPNEWDAPGMVADGLNGFRSSLNTLMFRFRTRPGIGSDFFSDLEVLVAHYDALRDYLKQQKQEEFVLSFEEIEEIIDATLPRAAHRASWWETLRSPQEKMPQREACLEAGVVATRLPDGKSVRFKKIKRERRRSHESEDV